MSNPNPFDFAPGNPSGPRPNGAMAQCPYCSEAIQSRALKCPHCGEILDRDLRVAKEQSAAQNDGIGLISIVCAALALTGTVGGLFCLWYGTLAGIPIAITGLILAIFATKHKKAAFILNSAALFPPIILAVLGAVFGASLIAMLGSCCCLPCMVPPPPGIAQNRPPTIVQNKQPLPNPAKKNNDDLREENRALAELKTADKLFSEGKRALAIPKYKDNFTSVNPDRQPEVVRRIVEHETGAGNVKEARRWVELALDKGLVPPYEAPAALKLARQVETERAEKIALEKKRREAEEARLKTEAEVEAKAAKEARVKAILADLKDPDTDVRREAVLAAAKLGDRAKEAVPGLAAAVLDNDKALRLAALDVLRKLGPESKAAVPNITKALSGKDAGTRQGAIQALAAIGPDAKDSAPALVPMLGNKDHRDGASQALIKIGKAAVPALITGLENTSPLVRQWSVRTLGEIGPDANDALPLLRARAQTDTSISVREDAQAAIGRIKK